MGSSNNFSTKIKPKLGNIGVPILYPDHPEHLSTEQRRIVAYLEAVRENLHYLKATWGEVG